MRLKEILFVEIGSLPAALLIILICGAMGSFMLGIALVAGVLGFVGVLCPIVEWSVTRTERMERWWYLDNPRLDPFGVNKRFFQEPSNKKWLDKRMKKEQRHETN